MQHPARPRRRPAAAALCGLLAAGVVAAWVVPAGPEAVARPVAGPPAAPVAPALAPVPQSVGTPSSPPARPQPRRTPACRLSSADTGRAVVPPGSRPASPRPCPAPASRAPTAGSSAAATASATHHPTASPTPRKPRSAAGDRTQTQRLPAAERRRLATGPVSASGAGAGARSDGSAGVAEVRQVRRPASYPQSLMYSGLLGLVISLTGLGLVMVRRRLW
jgi:hypothetical protein